MRKLFFVLLQISIQMGFILSSCSNNNNDVTKQQTVSHTSDAHLFSSVSRFNEDSAYTYLKSQVDFGPRIPGTNAHAKCAEYLVAQLTRFGWTVQIQTGDIITYDKKKHFLKNIIASYKQEKKERILLLAHWDTRPFADSDILDADKPFDSADDGPSGVAVILEIARQCSIEEPEIGLDILFSDLEDYGTENGNNTWALGTQFWTKNLHKPAYKAKYGILLDMVGAKNATFPREGLSREYAPYVVKKIWYKAAHLGYSDYFVFKNVRAITDDHTYVILDGNIPCVDIVNMDPVTESFGTHHHRHSDNLNVIDKNTLKAVGQTILEVLWEEQE